MPHTNNIQNRKGEYRSLLTVLAALLIAAIPITGHAQFSDSYNFLKAVRERDAETVTDILSEPGSVLVNTRDISNGESALHIVVQRRDPTWLGFLLGKGANPNIRDKAGQTPLMLATTLRFADGAQLLLEQGAQVDLANDSGETPLIRAVQLRDLAMVRLLLEQGANPDKTDSIAGKSARDYAAEDQRNSQIIEAINLSDKARKGEASGSVFGPEI